MLLEKPDQNPRSSSHCFSGQSGKLQVFIPTTCRDPILTLYLNLQIVRPFPGETCSGAYEIWRQLNVLQHLITGLKSLEITWFVKASQKTLREEINKLIAVFSKDDSYHLKGMTR